MICERCHGAGWIFSLPPGVNAFEMRVPALANAMRRVPCWICGGCRIASCRDAAGEGGPCCNPAPTREDEDA